MTIFFQNEFFCSSTRLRQEIYKTLVETFLADGFGGLASPCIDLKSFLMASRKMGLTGFLKARSGEEG